MPIKFKSVDEVKTFLENETGLNSLYWLDGTLNTRRYIVCLDERGQVIVHDTKTGSKHKIDEHYLNKIRIL